MTTLPPSDARYRIGAVARMTGVSTHALRAWERRYGTLQPVRTPAGDRLYTDADVDRVRLLKALIGYGYAISDLANLSASDLSRMLNEHRAVPVTGVPADEIARRYVDAIEAMDLEGAERVLARASSSLGPGRFIRDVIVPVLRSVGQLWEQGTLCVAQEHVASTLVRDHIGALLRSHSSRAFARRTVIATTPAGELHELGALMAAVVAAIRGCRTVYLGPSLPAAEIANAAKLSGAELVLLSCVSDDDSSLSDELVELARALPASTRVLLGGRAAPPSEALPRGMERVDSLDELERRLSS